MKMIKMIKTQRWIPALVALAAMAGATTLCQAGTLIQDTFSSSADVSSWFVGDGSGTLTYDNTFGNPAGSMAVVLNSATGTECDPSWNLPQDINVAGINGYQTVSFDVYVDASGAISGTPSGTTRQGPTWGYLQAVLIDTGYGWHSFGWTAMNSGFENQWQHMSFDIPATASSGGDIMQFMIQFTSSGQGYSGNVYYYLDNVTITPTANPNLIFAFNSSAWEASEGGNWGTTATVGWNQSLDATYVNPVTHASSTITPPGAMQINWNENYNGAIQMTGGGLDWNPSLWTYLSFDLYIEGTTGGSGLGGFQFFVENDSYSPQWIGAYNFSPSMVGTWTHYDIPIGSVSGLTDSPGWVWQSTGGSDGGGNYVTFDIDNIQVWSPVAAPQITGIKPNTLSGGVQMMVDGAGDQYDRNSLCFPSQTGDVDYFWLGNNGADYSMTLANFPSPAAAPGFEAHIFVANEDTCANAGYNETAGSVDWNANDLLVFRVENGASGGVLANVEWKTNAPASNATTGVNGNVQQFIYNNLTSANGKWDLVFTSDTTAEIIKDGTVMTANVTMPNFAADNNYIDNFQPSSSIIQWGVFKNDGANSGINNNDSYVLTAASVALNANATPNVLLTDNFSGPGLTANNAWRVSSSEYISWLPSGTAYWLTWTLPDGGFTVQSSASLLGPWADAGVTYTVPGVNGTTRLAAIPTASLPAGSAAFFRLINNE